MKKILGWIMFAIVAVVLVAGGGFYFWASDAYPPSKEAVTAMKSSIEMDGSDLLVFEPSTGASDTGFIIYPGGLVDPSSYAPFAKEIAELGFTVIITPMPFNLAVLAPDKAEEVIQSFDHIKHWAIGGHSLGGVMATQFAAAHKEIEGVVLLASYPMDDALKNTDTRVVSLYGTHDQVADLDQIKASSDLLPKESLIVKIEGGNHSQFGSYGHQDGDGLATISEASQREYAVHYTAQLLKSLSK